MPPIYFDAFTRFGPKPRKHPKHPYTLTQLVAEMHHCSISGAMVAATAQTMYDAMFENVRLIETLKPYDFLFPLWNVHPHWSCDFPEPSELTRLMQQHDVRAVTIHPSTNGWQLASRCNKPLLDELERARTPVIVEFSEVDVRDFEAVLDRHPKLPFILHRFTWSQGHAVEPLFRNYTNLHIGFDFFQSNYAVEKHVGLGHEDRLIYCSNAVEMSMGAHRTYIDYASISDTAKAKIAGGNLSRLLNGLKPPREIVNRNEDIVMAEARQGKPQSSLVIDMHAHMLDEGLNSAGSGYAMYKGGPKGTHELARRMGVDAMGIMSWNGTVGVHADQGNQCVTDAINAFPDFYWGLATVDVLHETAESTRAKFEQIFKDKRFLGLKPYPQYGVPYNDPRFDPWWQFGNERKLYCGLHPVNWFQPGEFESICSRFPDLTVVAYHGGGDYTIADTCIALAKKFPNFMIEITLTPVCAGIIDYLVENAGADRVLYGSDLPMRDPRQQFGWVAYSRLSIEDKLKVLGGNAKRLLDRVRAANA